MREAIVEYVLRHDVEQTEAPTEEVWGRLLDGYYEGDGSPNDPDDIYE